MRNLNLILLLLLVLMPLTMRAEDPYNDDEKAVMKRYYELFGQADREAEFEEVNKQVRDIMERHRGRQGYYVNRVNEVTYQINIGHSDKALRLAEEVLEEMREKGDSNFDMIYTTIATIYEDRGNYKMSRYYCEKAIEAVAPTDTIGMIGAYLAMANLETSNHPDEALRLVDHVLPYCRNYPSHQNYGRAMKALAYFFKNDAQAFFQILDEYNIQRRDHDLRDEQNDGIMQTIKHVFRNEYDEALKLIGNKNLYSENMGYYDMLIQLYRLKGDKDMVIAQQQRKLNAIDSLNADLIFENMNRMDAEMKVNSAQQEVIRARFYWLTAVVALLMVVLGLLVWRYLTRRGYQKRLLRKNQELEVALDHAKESDRMKAAFIEHVSHEIRTPLNVITGFAQIITNPDYEVDAEERDRMIGDISKNTNQITNIINDLLELANDESKEYYDKNDMVDVVDLCQHVMAHAEQLNDGRLELRFRPLVNQGYTIKTNQLVLEKMLTQLMNNALKFTEQGSVELGVRERAGNGGTEFCVTDTGIGIRKEDQDKVFDRFYKADGFKPGFGLGLTLCHKSARLLGGTLELDKKYTKGARFVLVLPNAF